MQPCRPDLLVIARGAADLCNKIMSLDAGPAFCRHSSTIWSATVGELAEPEMEDELLAEWDQDVHASGYNLS